MTQQSTPPKPGDKMPDGTVYAGKSPDTDIFMYTTPAGSLLAYTFNEACGRAQDANAIKALDHDDWRVPTKNELNVLFNNSAAIGGFNPTDTAPAVWYWSSSPYFGWGAWGQRFSDGDQYYYDKSRLSSVRLVRTEAPKTSRSKESGNHSGQLIL